MNRFEFARPGTTAEAVALLSEKPDEVAPLAGGTDLLSLMKDFVVEPKRLVSLMGVAELGTIAAAGEGLRIGATATIDALLAEGTQNGWREKWPALFQAADGIRSPQLRAMGTVGGELLQRPRCWYFRHGHGLLATDGKGESLVEKGDHRYHAVLGNEGKAKFVSPSSLAPALFALNATIETVGPGGKKSTPVRALYKTPADAGQREFTLAPNEILTAIVLPAPKPKSATVEVRPRQGLDWPLAAASVALELDGSGKVKSAEVVLGHVAPRPWIAEGAGKALAGKEVNVESIAAAADAALAGATPLPKNAYKVDLAKVAVRRALAAAAGMKST